MRIHNTHPSNVKLPSKMYRTQSFQRFFLSLLVPSLSFRNHITYFTLSRYGYTLSTAPFPTEAATIINLVDIVFKQDQTRDATINMILENNRFERRQAYVVQFP